MSYQQERYNIQPMTKEQFLDFFHSNYKNAFINDVIEQDIFVHSMVRILIRTLMIYNNYSIPFYYNFDNEEYYKFFNKEEYIEKLCQVLNHKSVEDLVGKIPSKRPKGSDYSKLMATIYMTGAIQNALPIAVMVAETTGVLMPGTSQVYTPWHMQNIAPNFMGYSFSEIVQEAADKICKKKDKKKLTNAFFDKVDIVSKIVKFPQVYGTTTDLITTTINASKSVHYYMEIGKQEKDESINESRRIINDLKHKFIKKNVKKNKTIYQIDKKTLFSMLLFAHEYALNFSIEI